MENIFTTLFIQSRKPIRLKENLIEDLTCKVFFQPGRSVKRVRPNRSKGSVVIHGKYFYHFIYSIKKTYQVKRKPNKGPDLPGFLPTWQVCEKSKTQ